MKLIKKKFWELSASNVKLRRVDNDEDKNSRNNKVENDENLITKIMKKPEDFRLIAEIENGEIIIRIREKAE